MNAQIERRLAIAELLAQPDPPDLGSRNHRLCLDGKPDRYLLVPVLSAAFVQEKLLELHERRAVVTGGSIESNAASVYASQSGDCNWLCASRSNVLTQLVRIAPRAVASQIARLLQEAHRLPVEL